MPNTNTDHFAFLHDLFDGTDVDISCELTPEQAYAADMLNAKKEDFLQQAAVTNSRMFRLTTTGSLIDRRTLIGKEPFYDAAPYEPARSAELAKFAPVYASICRASKVSPLNQSERPPALGFFNYKDRLKSYYVYDVWIAISNERQLAEIEYMAEGNLWPNLAVLRPTWPGQIDWDLCKMSRLHRLHPDPFPIRSLIIR